MLEWLKKYFNKETPHEQVEEVKPILITIHGFGTRRSKEMDVLKEWSKNHLPEVKAFDMFDPFDELDSDWHKWLKKAEDVMKEAQIEKREIYLLGYSMGGVLASYLASKYPVKKLILVAPAFLHFNIENYASLVIKGANHLLNSGKNEDEKKPSMSTAFYTSFLDCVKHLKGAIVDVSCPVLIIQGDNDAVISTRSSEWAFNQIKHEQKRCLFIHGGTHRLLSDFRVNNEAFLLIKLFIDDEILPFNLPDNESLLNEHMDD